jgi:hypothetical protein
VRLSSREGVEHGGTGDAREGEESEDDRLLSEASGGVGRGEDDHELDEAEAATKKKG